MTLQMFKWELNTVDLTRGHLFKVLKNRCNLEIRKHFSKHIINQWNSLPSHVVSAPTVNSFKSKLDNYWQIQIWTKSKANGLNCNNYACPYINNNSSMGESQLFTELDKIMTIMIIFHVELLRHDAGGGQKTTLSYH